MHRIRWDDLQYVLTVAKEGSVSAAAKALGVNHSTVLRRLTAFEYRHKLQVFHKLPTGYKLTVEGQRLLESAFSIESTVRSLERKIFGQEMKLEGQLRLTTTDALLRLVLGKYLADFHRFYPRIQLELCVTSQSLELSKLEADVAIRPAQALPEDHVGIRLCDMAFGVYGAPDYISRLQGKHPLESAHWLEMIQGSASRSVSNSISQERVVLKADSFEPLLSAAEQGIGLTYLPCFVGESSEKLQRIDIEVEHKGTGLWIMTHKDLENAARVKAFFEFIEAELKVEYNRLAGIGLS